MTSCLVKVSPLDVDTGLRVDVRLSCFGQRENALVNGLGGNLWEPAITKPPVLGIALWNGDFTAAVDPAATTLVFNIETAKRSHPDIAQYFWAGAAVEIYAGDPSVAWPWPVAFAGRVRGYGGEYPTMTLNAEVDTEPFEKNVLAATYAGTGGAEGGDDIKNQPKPLAIGWPRNVEPKLIDATNNVYQFSGYGAIEAVTTLYERGAEFGASTGDFASYAALIAATIPAGSWGTCLAAGMIRLGAPQFGVITGDIKGHKVGSTTPRLPGAIIEALATIAGVSGARIETASLDDLDTAMAALGDGGNTSLVITSQADWLEWARRFLVPTNWQAGVSLTGNFFVAAVDLAPSAAITLDAQGHAEPQVTKSEEMDVSLPYTRTTLGAERAWRVHGREEIAFTAIRRRDPSPIDAPEFDAPPFTYEASPGGGVDLTAHFTWAGDEETIDGFSAKYYVATAEEGARTYYFGLDILGAQALYIREDGARAYMSAESGHVLEYDLVLRDEMGTADLLHDFDLSAVLAGSVRGITFGPDGLNMYIAEFAATPRIRRYTLSTAWDLSTATHVQNLTTVQAVPTGVAISTDGTRLYYTGHDLGGGGSEITEVPLGTSWSLASAGTPVTEDVSAHFETITDLFIRDNGEDVFLCGQTASLKERVKRFAMDAWDVSTIAATSELRDVEDMQSLIRGLDFTRDGMCMMVIDENDLVRCYEMETAYDIENSVDPPNEPGTFGNPYVFGSNPVRETLVETIQPSERKLTLLNVAADSYYTVGLFARRQVDPGVDPDPAPDGMILSDLEELPALSGFLPYRPKSAAEFQGRMTGGYDGGEV